mgnify:CR=1 FL=1
MQGVLVWMAAVGALGLAGWGGAPTPRPAHRQGSTIDKSPTFITGNLDPMIVDWQPEQRGDLEVSMRDGLVVVAYDKRGFRLLRDCHVDGTYDFMGMTRREKVVRLESAEDIRANLPMAGLGLAAQLGGELEQGATLDIAMVMVGKLRTTWKRVTRKDLVGQCEGATHVVRGATVGAFAVDTGERARARAVAEIFGMGGGGGTRSHSAIRVIDGRLDACQAAGPDSDRPPRQCGALIRVELLPVVAEGARAPVVDPELRDVCPPGLVRVEGKCTRAKAARAPIECKYGEGRACFDQCKAGNQKSCAKVARMAVFGEGGVPKAPDLAAGIAAKTCDKGEPTACTLLGDLLITGTGVQKDMGRAAKAYAKGCDDGDPDGCSRVGTQLLTGQGVDRNTQVAATALLRGCKGGSHGACSDLGLLYLGGSGFPKNLPLAAGLFKRACDGESSVGCSNFAYMQEFGMGVNRNQFGAVNGYAKACRLDKADCTWYGAMVQLGKGVPKDEREAVRLYKESCNAGNVVACAIVRAYLDPNQKLDVEQAKAYVNVWKATCQSGIARDCSGLGVLAHSIGGRDEGRSLLARGCQLGDDWGCLMQRMQVRVPERN